MMRQERQPQKGGSPVQRAILASGIINAYRHCRKHGSSRRIGHVGACGIAAAVGLLQAPPVCHDGVFVNTGDATWLVEQ